MITFISFTSRHETEQQSKTSCCCHGFETTLNKKKKKISRARQGCFSYCVLSLEFELVNSQSLRVLQLLDLLHLLVVASDLLIDDHLYTPTGGGGN